jgi:hypothetical protein
VTLFADAQVMLPDNAARQRFVSAWAARANQHRDLIVALEVANESWQNGFEGPSGVTQLRALGAQLAAATPVPVALSSLPSPDDWCRVYAGVAGIDFASVHYDRDISGPERQWRPVAQPWGYPANYERGCEGRLPRAAISNEPIGPQSSVADDADPLRLALSVAMTFVSGNAAYVYHSGAGIRGGGAADLARGRAADFSKADSAVLDAIAAVRRRLPDGLANWTRHDAASSAMPWDGFSSIRLLARPWLPARWRRAHRGPCLPTCRVIWWLGASSEARTPGDGRAVSGGRREDRTRDLYDANVALSQLS